MQPAPVPVPVTSALTTAGASGKIPTPQNNQSELISSLNEGKLLFIPKLIHFVSGWSVGSGLCWTSYPRDLL